MRRLMTIVVAVAAVVVVVLAAITGTAYAQIDERHHYIQVIQDTWVIAVGRLEMYVRADVMKSEYDRQLPTAGSFMAYGVAVQAGRAEAEARLDAAVHALCDHDPRYCQEVFTAHGIRWGRR